MNPPLSIETATQLAVFLANRPGALARVCEALAKAEINIHALATSDTVDHTVVRMVVSDPTKDRAHSGTNMFHVPIMINWGELELALWIGVLRNLSSNTGFVIRLRGIRHLQNTSRSDRPQKGSGARKLAPWVNYRNGASGRNRRFIRLLQFVWSPE
jgi:hypothetical protein